MVLCLSMAVSSSIIFCSAKESTKNRTPPPELIIGEGEVWVPDAIDPRLIQTRGSDDECRHGGGSPDNYRYIGAVRGNTTADVRWVSVRPALCHCSFQHLLVLHFRFSLQFQELHNLSFRVIALRGTILNINIYTMLAQTPIYTGSTHSLSLQL